MLISIICRAFPLQSYEQAKHGCYVTIDFAASSSLI